MDDWHNIHVPSDPFSLRNHVHSLGNHYRPSIFFKFNSPNYFMLSKDSKKAHLSDCKICTIFYSYGIFEINYIFPEFLLDFFTRYFLNTKILRHTSCKGNVYQQDIMSLSLIPTSVIKFGSKRSKYVSRIRKKKHSD